MTPLACRYVCLTSADPLTLNDGPDRTVTQPFVCTVVPLAEGSERLWRSRLRGTLRKDIARGLRRGTSPAASSRREDLGVFYDLYRQTSRRHGMPPQPRRLFDEMWDAFGPEGRIALILARVGGRAIAAELFVEFKDVSSLVYAGADYRFLDFMPFKVLDWFAIEMACARGYRSLDLLQSHVTNAGLRWYKQGFGGVEVPVRYHYDPGVGRTGWLREVVVGRRFRSANALRALVRALPAPGLDAVGRLVFRHVG